MSLRDLSKIAQPEPPRSGQVRALARLAGPVVLARAGNTVLNVTNLVIIGHAGAAELARQSVAFSLTNTLQMIGFGLLTGTLVTVAVGFGREDYVECGRAWRRSLHYAVGLGILGAVLSGFAAELLQVMGQPPEFAAAVGRVTLILGWSLPAQLLFVATSFFLEAIGRPHPGMIAIGLGAAANGLLCWALVFGHGGLPALGAEGTAIANLAVRVLLAAGLIVYALSFREAARFGTRRSGTGGWQSGASQRRIGYADGLSLGIESGSFTLMNIFAATLGTAAVGAYAIALSLLGIIFTFALGISAATAVLVGRAYGRQSARGVAFCGWLGIAVNTGVMVLAGVPLLLAPASIAHLYSTDPVVIVTAVPLILIIAVTMIGDGGQRVVAQSLRGCHDAWFPTALHMVSYAILMVPLGWTLAFGLGFGVTGLLLAIALASVASLAVLSTRFGWITRALRARWEPRPAAAREGLR
ncbi:MAG TPA: MATE family efflux transporter [Stellaceae bacterium]|nr:MATE family efflux transporter [Stellaceae bacterium]